MTDNLELELLRETIEFLPLAVAIFDQEDRFLHWNRKYAELYAWGAHLLVRGRPFEDYLRELLKLRRSPDALGREEEWLAERMARHRASASTHEHEIADGRWVRVEERRLASGGTIGVRVDITDLKQRELKLAHLAHHDHLTGLPNRTALHGWLRDAVAAGNAAALLVDLDGFKDVNDSWGHAAGDRVLKQAAGRLAACVGEGGFTARMGGDEFIAVLPGCADPLAAFRLAARIVDRMGEPFAHDEREMRLGASIGIALSPAHATGPDELLHCADLALYQAKDSGRNCYRLFTPVLQSAKAARLRFGQELYRAIAADEFVLHYQPQIRLSDGALIGAEALLRWQHPQLGLLKPAAFLPAMLGGKQGGAIGAWVFATACRQGAAWRAMGHDGFRMAVNAGPLCVRSGAILEQVRNALESSGLDPANLEVEVTEDTVLKNSDVALGALHGLNEMGVRLALDDYGTGYASLSLLKDLPLRRLKIDRSFIAQMTQPGEGAVVRAILQLAEGFGLGVIAEGIETAAQAETLRQLGCQEGQGYWVAQALPAAEFQARFIAPAGGSADRSS